MKQAVYLAGSLGLIVLLWHHALVYPLKLLVVFFHEASHALVTVATGGTVRSMAIDPQQGGQVIAVGGSRFLSLSAGYLGSLAWGMLIYLLATGTRRQQTIMVVLGLTVAGITVAYVRNLFGLAFGCLAGCGMLAAGWWVRPAVNGFLLRLIGLTSMLYAPLDIYSDTIARSQLRSDARMLAEEFGGATVVWGGLWMVISLLAVVYCLRRSLRMPAQPEP
jgi:hypothetical protein